MPSDLFIEYLLINMQIADGTRVYIKLGKGEAILFITLLTSAADEQRLLSICQKIKLLFLAKFADASKATAAAFYINVSKLNIG